MRFPVAEGSPLGAECPLCGAPTEWSDVAWRTQGAPPPRSPLPGPPLEALLDNVRSLRNVGAIFRTADGAGVRHLHLGGFTPTPEHPKLAKTALGAERSVGWTRHLDPAAAAATLVQGGARLWALEGGEAAEDLFEIEALDPSRVIVLVLGHEVSGVDPRVAEHCERTICIPMAGHKGSLNVSTAFGVAAFTLRHALRRPTPATPEA